MRTASYVYILASGRYGTLYVGVTSNLIQRVWQHRESLAEGYTREYRVKRLVWFEQHEDILAAITREKQIKKWRRDWKIELIQKANPLWRDLFEDFSARYFAGYDGCLLYRIINCLWIPAFAGMTAYSYFSWNDGSSLLWRDGSCLCGNDGSYNTGEFRRHWSIHSAATNPEGLFMPSG